MKDFVLNGIAHGPIAEKLMAVNWDVGALRPWMGSNGVTYVTITQNGQLKNIPISNATTTLRQYDWKQMDKAVVQTAKQRLKAVAAIRSAGLTYNIPNGMAKTVLETETVSDINDAQVTMDALHKGPADRPVFEVSQLPLPIHHYDFHYSARQIQASRNGGSPLDTTTAEMAGRKVAESIEKMLLGKLSTYTFGGGTIYGFTNYTSALTKTITSPATSGWTGATIVSEMLAARQQSMDAYHYGPWILLTAPSWDQYLDQDYSSAKGDNTVRDRLAKISGIQSIITCDYLTSYEMVLVQLSTDVCRLIEGMDITTVQWESDGGFLVNFKVMAIVVPQLRADQNSNTGIVYMST
jgi:uncharacterized linocin/CFP29 family protein